MFSQEERWTEAIGVEDDHADIDIIYSPENYGSTTGEGGSRPASPEVVYVKCEYGDLFENEAEAPQIPAAAPQESPARVHKCYVCNRVFSQQCYLTQHNQRWHSGEKPFKCTRCGKRFAEQAAFTEHVIKHTDEKPHKCELCPKQFMYRTDLRRHMSRHTGLKPYACEICGKDFVRNDHMLKHTQTHARRMIHLTQQNAIKCMEPFSEDILQQARLGKPALSVTVLLNCDRCPRQFSLQADLLRHMGVHSKEKTHICAVCGKGFSRGSHLKRHSEVHVDGLQVEASSPALDPLTDHEPVDRKPFPEDLTYQEQADEYPFSDDFAYQEQADEDPFSDDTNYQPQADEDPFAHDDDTYPEQAGENDVSYQEQVDEKPFSDEVTYVEQVGENFSHGTVREPHADIEFYSGENDQKPKAKKAPREKLHPSQKPYECQLCPMRFINRHDLTRHMCLHTGKKPHACPICGKGFIRKDHLRKHCMNIHKTVPLRYQKNK